MVVKCTHCPEDRGRDCWVSHINEECNFCKKNVCYSCSKDGFICPDDQQTRGLMWALQKQMNKQIEERMTEMEKNILEKLGLS